MKNVVGPRIRELRRERDERTSQEELVARLQADGIDIDQSALSRIENGERLVTDIEILALCRALSVSIEDLFRGLSGR